MDTASQIPSQIPRILEYYHQTHESIYNPNAFNVGILMTTLSCDLKSS